MSYKNELKDMEDMLDLQKEIDSVEQYNKIKKLRGLAKLVKRDLNTTHPDYSTLETSIDMYQSMMYKFISKKGIIFKLNTSGGYAGTYQLLEDVVPGKRTKVKLIEKSLYHNREYKTLDMNKMDLFNTYNKRFSAHVIGYELI